MSTLFWTGFAESSNTPKWIFISAIIPFLLLGRDFPKFKIGTLFLLSCVPVFFWSVSPLDTIYRFWILSLLAVCFLYGSTLDESATRRTVIGFTWGMAINAVIAVLQSTHGLVFIGWQGFESGYWFHVTQSAPPGGLFINKNVMGEASLLAFVGAVCVRHWWPLPFLAVGLYLSSSLGVYVAGGIVGLFWLYQRSRLTAVGLVVLGLLAMPWEAPTVAGRMALYRNSVEAIIQNPFGYGAFWNVYPAFHNAAVETPDVVYSEAVRPRTAHNDILTLAVEFGLPAAVLFLLCFLSIPMGALIYVPVAFMALGLFAFPLSLPASVFMAGLCAGHLVGRRNHNGVSVPLWRVLIRGRPKGGAGGRYASNVHVEPSGNIIPLSIPESRDCRGDSGDKQRHSSETGNPRHKECIGYGSAFAAPQLPSGPSIFARRRPGRGKRTT